ncbi:MAG: RagB/SusD family nutrient uptake outer membrane protein [Bacteroidota bacterium]
MKKLILVVLTIFFLAESCNNLDLEPLDRVTENTFYKTEADFDGAIFASYASIQKFWGLSTETLGERGEYWKLSLATSDDVIADDLTSDQRSRNLDNLLFDPFDVPFQALYSMIYEGIYRANLVIDKLDDENELSEEQKGQLEAEAKFLRAWFHFQAMKMWGTPPLVTEVLRDLNGLAQPNATQETLFAQILSDFNDAANGLPEGWDDANLGRATAWAAKAYVGKVNVWQEDWPAAIAAFEDVIQNGPYMLMGNYEDVFAFNNENNAESIFEIQFGGPFSDDNLWVFDDIHSEAFKATQGIARTNLLDAGNGAPGGKNGWLAPSQDLLDAYEPGDLRREVTLYQEGDMYYTTNPYEEIPYDPTWSSSNLTMAKYRGARNVVPENHAPHGQADFNNERWLRLAELKLLYAEALVEQGRQGEALVQVNDIRRRAGLADLADAGNVTEALRQEKRIELALEPHRWFDITRWGIGAEVFGDRWEDRLNLFPFPQSEIDRSAGVLQQNPGY